MEKNQEKWTNKYRLPLQTADEIAGLFHVSRSTVYRLMKQKIIPCVRLGRAVRFDPLAVYGALEDYYGYEDTGCVPLDEDDDDFNEHDTE